MRTAEGQSKSKIKRLEAEAAFQDSRVQTDEPEARSKFYYLAGSAKGAYRQVLSGLHDVTVVVVGCSTGGVRMLARQGNHAIGVDISSTAIGQLNEAIQREGLQERASAYIMDGEDLRLPPRSVDVIACSGVLHHLDVECACRSWTNVLKDEGCVYMVEPLAWNPLVALYRALTPATRTRDEHPLVPGDFQILRRYFRRVEFEACALTTLISLVFVYVPNVFELRQRLHRILTPVDRLLFKRLPFLKFFAWTSFIRCEGVLR